MKKFILFTALAIGFNFNINTMKQENFKFSDGTTFTEFEKTFRTKYSKIHIPVIKVTSDSPDIGSYHPASNTILVHPKTKNTNQNELEWVLLHETGHAQKPWIIPSIFWTVTSANLLTPYFWGMHRKKPYKNIATKSFSKLMGTLFISAAINIPLRNLEERRADNFANAIADQQALQGGIKLWKYNHDFCNQSTLEYKLQRPTHPSLPSRIQKIQTALQKRFENQELN